MNVMRVKCSKTIMVIYGEFDRERITYCYK
nr:MAG TPA: hypothetical protein [Caudoviricetes sp.]